MCKMYHLSHNIFSISLILKYETHEVIIIAGFECNTIEKEKATNCQWFDYGSVLNTPSTKWG